MVAHRLLEKLLGRRVRKLSPRAAARVAAALTAASLTSGCATVALDQGGSLASYSELQPSDGVVTKSKLYVREAEVLAARTVRIIPATIADKAKAEGITDEERRLVANVIDRSLCAGLSERFTVVAANDDADLTVHSRITVMTPTNEAAAAASKGASVAKTVLLPGVPVPIPRIPIGLGSLSVEAEARARDGRQQGAMVWGRGANALSGSARISAAGDAYELASAFGDDFSRMLVTGKTPFGKLGQPPSMDRIQSWAGGAPKYAACEAFGREPGIAGLVGGAIGVPPGWNDKAPEAGTATAQAQ